MADRGVRVDVARTFLERLDAIEAFLVAADAPSAYERLLEELETVVVRHLAAHPRIGRRFLDIATSSVEGTHTLHGLAGSPDGELREFLHGDDLVLYWLAADVVTLLTIRHHRELAYDLTSVWSR